MRPRTSLFISFPLLFSFLAPFTARAQWPANGVAVCTATGNQQSQDMVADGAAGSIVVWEDLRSGNWDIYAQRVSATGMALWAANGVAICSAPNDQHDPKIVPDGSGGAIIVWWDKRDGSQNDIYAQRVNSAGVAQWAANGVIVCGAAGAQTHPVVCVDGAGGAIVAWADLRGSISNDLYAQHVSSGGTMQWATNGIPICTAPNGQIAPNIVEASGGAAVIRWTDGRFGVINGFSTLDVFAQRVGAGGVTEWAPDGIAVGDVATFNGGGPIVSDGTGGWIIAWSEALSGNDADNVFVQRISPCSALLWTANGVGLGTTADSEYEPSAVSDGAGGAIVTWERTSYDSGTMLYHSDIYTQRINALGASQWSAGGVPVCTAPNQQAVSPAPITITDGAGGALTVWQDERNGPAADIYAQRINATGVVQWATNGVVACNAAGYQTSPTAVSDGAGGAIVAWIDNRNGNADIYAIRIGSNGQIPTAVSGPERPPAFIVGEIYPNPFSTKASLEIQLPSPSDVRIQVVDVAGRRVKETTLKDVAAGTHTLEFDTRNDNGRQLPNGVYFYHVTTNAGSATRKLVVVH